MSGSNGQVAAWQTLLNSPRPRRWKDLAEWAAEWGKPVGYFTAPTAAATPDEAA